MQGVQSPALGGFTIWQWLAVAPSKIAQTSARLNECIEKV
jgi:hypothetical protein